MKDHCFVRCDGWWHLFNISGTGGYYHGYNGNEETIAWSISKDLVNWEFRGHVLHASQREGYFDQHEVWAPFCLKGEDGFYMYYTGIVHPNRPMEYRKLGHGHPWNAEGHKETQGIARSTDLTDWVKISDPKKGAGIPGRDSHVVRDEDGGRWLLYSTIIVRQVHVSESFNLVDWKPLGICAEFPCVSESLTVMRHPLNNMWIMLGNERYILSNDPLCFRKEDASVYDLEYDGRAIDCGFACEIIENDGCWYRSGAIGRRDYWRLGFTEIEWTHDGAFRIVKPSVLSEEKRA
jgi:hypothetical protein